MLPKLFNPYGQYLTKNTLADVGDFKIGERSIITNVIFGDDTAIIEDVSK